jgi:hypothetical protein
MPYITVEEDIDIDDVLNDCSPRELVEAAKWLVDHAADDVKEALIEAMRERPEAFDRGFVNSFKVGGSNRSSMEDEFEEKMQVIASKYYSLSPEDEKALEEIYQKYK